MKIKTNELYVIVNMVTANIVDDGVFVIKKDADIICNKINSLGSYCVLPLSEHIASLMTWFEKGYQQF